jgi:hypothetical protein
MSICRRLLEVCIRGLAVSFNCIYEEPKMATNGSGKTPGSLPPSLAQQQGVVQPAFTRAASPALASTSKGAGTVAGSTGQEKLNNLRAGKSPAGITPTFNQASGAAKKPATVKPPVPKPAPPASTKGMPTPGGMGQSPSAARVVLPGSMPKKTKPIIASPSPTPTVRRTSAHPMQPTNPVPKVKSDFARAAANKTPSSSSKSQAKSVNKGRSR